MSELILEQKKLKALSVESRVNILKQLDKRRYTLSELSESLKMSKPTIKEHLDILEDAGFVKKLPSENKWIYYELTKDGQKVFRPQDTKILFMFCLSFVATILVGIYMIVGFTGFAQTKSFVQDQILQKSADAGTLMTTSVTATEVTNAMVESVSSRYLVPLVVFIVLFLITVILLIRYMRYKRR